MSDIAAKIRTSAAPAASPTHLAHLSPARIPTALSIVLAVALVVAPALLVPAPVAPSADHVHLLDVETEAAALSGRQAAVAVVVARAHLRQRNPPAE